MNAKKNPDLVSGRLKGTPDLQGPARGKKPTAYCRDRLGLTSEASPPPQAKGPQAASTGTVPPAAKAGAAARVAARPGKVPGQLIGPQELQEILGTSAPAVSHKANGARPLSPPPGGSRAASGPGAGAGGQADGRGRPVLSPAGPGGPSGGGPNSAAGQVQASVPPAGGTAGAATGQSALSSGGLAAGAMGQSQCGMPPLPGARAVAEELVPRPLVQVTYGSGGGLGPRRLVPMAIAGGLLLVAVVWGIQRLVGGGPSSSAAAQPSAIAATPLPVPELQPAGRPAPPRGPVPQTPAPGDSPVLGVRTGSQAAQSAVDPAARPDGPAGSDAAKAGRLEGSLASLLRWAQGVADRPAPGSHGDRPRGQDPNATVGSRPASGAVPPPAAVEYIPCPSGFHYTGVVHQPNGSLANINGRFVRVGERVDGARVVRIDRLAVEMERDGKRFLVSFGGEEASGSPKRREDSAAGDEPAGAAETPLDAEAGSSGDDSDTPPAKPATKSIPKSIKSSKSATSKRKTSKNQAPQAAQEEEAASQE